MSDVPASTIFLPGISYCSARFILYRCPCPTPLLDVSVLSGIRTVQKRCTFVLVLSFANTVSGD